MTITRKTGWLCLLLLTVNPTIWAAEVNAILDNNITVTAQYEPGDTDKEAVLVLHGFMTTRNFGTVQSIVNELATNGYTVLAPTLSANINERRASVPCDAIHTATMADDIAEIAFWIDWLVERGHRRITLIGHSTGSLQLVAYAEGNPSPHVTRIIATSLVHTHRYVSPGIIAAERAEANEASKQSPPPIRPYHIVFCDDFLAPPQVYLSYMEWTAERVVTTVQNAQLPIEVIMGGSDRRFGPEWITLLEAYGGKVTVIEGASHFFDATHEFELLDRILAMLE